MWFKKLAYGGKKYPQKINKTLRKVLVDNFTEKQLESDDVDIFQDNNKIHISIGDWAEIDTSKLKQVVQSVFGSSIKITCEAEYTPDGNWIRII